VRRILDEDSEAGTPDPAPRAASRTAPRAALREDAPARPALALRSVSYAYRRREQVVTEVGLTVADGRTLALTGATGCGKSTLLRIAAGLLAPDEGTALAHGADVLSMPPDIRRRHLAYVPQEGFLFADTVRGNVALDLEHVLPDDELWAVLRVAQADRFVAGLPSGLDTRIGERGESLSGGQRQRLALARALAHRPGLLLLDDATSGLDAVTEAAFVRALRDQVRAATVFVSNRQASLALADEVILLRQGRVAARGTHDRLLAESGEYARLVRSHAARPAEAVPGGRP
jgi:ATP-binding cassette, subfamily B, bacterial